jgi:archaetidylinositol phosphate synthase
MASKFRLRRIFRPFIELLARGLGKIGVNPNLATIIMLCFSILSFFALVFFFNLFFFSIFVFFGGFFDSVMDRTSEFVIFFALLFYCWNSILWGFFDMKIIIIISFLSSIMISYLRARAETFYKGDFDCGLMARSERLFYLFITMLIANFYGFVNEFLFLFMILVIATAYFRYIKIKKLIRNFEKGN